MKTQKTIKLWAEQDRPREKLLEKGPDALSNSELLAILINTGLQHFSALDIAKDILATCNHNLLELGQQTIANLRNTKGIGLQKAITLIAAFELGKRRQLSEALIRPTVRTSRESFEILIPYFIDKQREQFYVVYLSQGNRVICVEPVSSGGLTSTIVDCRIIFQKALELKIVTQLILAHNHPSGNLIPSPADRHLTQKIKEGGALLEIKLLDHLILGDNQYYSFADGGIL